MKREDLIAIVNPKRLPQDRLAFLSSHDTYLQFDSGPLEGYWISRVKQGWKVGKKDSWLIEPTLDEAIDVIIEDRDLMTEDEHEAEERELMLLEQKR